MKLKLNKEHKSKSSREKADKEEEKLLKPQKKVLSFTRVKEKKAKALEVQQVTGPDLEDFRDLIDDDEPTPEEDELLGTGFPRRSKSTMYGKTLSASQSLHEPKLERIRSSRRSEPGEQHSQSKPVTSGTEDRALTREDKPLPRLVAPRTTVAETIAANRAASKTLAASQTLKAGLEPQSDKIQGSVAVDESSECQPINDRSERGAAKKKHSTIGHLWKAVKNDLLNPKAAAADLTAISVSAASMSMSAAKQAGQAMNTVANKVESDISSLHDQILGGKRNLPDHSPSGKPTTRSTKVAASKSSRAEPKSVEISVLATGAAELTGAPVLIKTDSAPAKGPDLDWTSSTGEATLKKAAEPRSQPKKPPPETLKVKAPAATGSPASEGLTVQKSKGSAYMLSKYEDEPESPSSLTEALTKTAEVLTQGTKAVLSNANDRTRYVRRMLMCGTGGRNKH